MLLFYWEHDAFPHMRQSEKSSAKCWQSVNPVRRGAFSVREGAEVQREVRVTDTIWNSKYVSQNYLVQCISFGI